LNRSIEGSPKRQVLFRAQGNFAPVVLLPTNATRRIVRPVAFLNRIGEDCAEEPERARRTVPAPLLGLAP
jgi:hypothetical protein